MTSVWLRELAAEERTTLNKLAHSRTAPAHLVQRAQIIWLASGGQTASAIAARVHLDGETVRKRIHRFNAEGLEGLKDRHRSGHPFTYTPEQIATVIAMQRSRIDEILIREGLRWRKHETWFGERVDPAFAVKRGPSKRSTPHHLRAVV